MSNLTRAVFTLAALLALPSATASAASLAGTIRDEGGAGLSGMEVRVWANADGKGWTILSTVATGGDGTWGVDPLVAGEYLVDVRMPNGMTGNYADRWYDVAEPLGDGWVQSDADVITLEGDTARAGVDIVMPIAGGLDGRIVGGGAPAAGIVVRAERASLPAVHHTDRSDTADFGEGAHHGNVYFRGLPPADDYRFLVYDLGARWATAEIPGPFTVTADANAAVGDVTLTPVPDDPQEPNNGPTDGASFMGPLDELRAEEPVPFVTSGARIAPRGDVDWYCFDAEEGERFRARTTSRLPFDAERDDPWLDPTIALWTGDGTGRISENDDGGDGRNALLETEELEAGRYCFVVSTFGDTTYDGTNQQSTGAYEFSVELANRRPRIQIFRDGVAPPPPPGAMIVDEGLELTLEAVFSDPDDDELTLTVTNTGADGEEVTEGELITAADAAIYTWTIGERAAEQSPYTVRFVVSDGSAEAEASVNLTVRAVNQPPPTPTLLSPMDGESIAINPTQLIVQNVEDVDGDALQYEFELYRGDIDEDPDEQGLIGEGPADTTAWLTGPLTENQRVTWRARAYDGASAAAFSPWTEPFTFVVNEFNEAPQAPRIVKPAQNESVFVVTPAIAVTGGFDPDREPVTYRFEVATDAAFADVVATAEGIEPLEGDDQTEWVVEPPLEYDRSYVVRAWAVDPGGAESEPSDTVSFRVAANVPPDPPVIGGDLGARCISYAYEDGAPDHFEVTTVTDPEGQQVSIQLQVHGFDDDPTQVDPIVDETVPVAEGTDTVRVDVDPTLFQEDVHYRVRVRALDETSRSTWSGCDFSVNTENSPPTALTIIDPADGQVYPQNTTEITAVVENATDPDGGTLEIAWCLSATADFASCGDDPRFWEIVSADDGDRTSFTITELSTDEVYHLRACALDNVGVCGPADEVTFSVGSVLGGAGESGCGCSATPSPRAAAPFVLALFGLVGLRRRRR